MEIEIWNPVLNYPEYEVSNLGNVRRGNMVKSQYVNASGYKTIRISTNNKVKSLLVHRLVLEAFVGKQAGKECRHLDGHKENNKLDNLCWGTAKENYQDKVRHGTSNQGGRGKVGQLNEEQVKQIHRLYREGRYTSPQLAKKYNVAVNTIVLLLRRETWAHVGDE